MIFKRKERTDENLSYVTDNDLTDLMQKTAWRFVRSAKDRFGMNAGSQKLLWCVDRMRSFFPFVDNEVLEDYVRAAYINFKIDTDTYQSF